MKKFLAAIVFTILCIHQSSAQEQAKTVIPLSAIVGKWEYKKEIDGNMALYSMHFKKDSTFQFWLKSADTGMIFMYAEGRVTLTSLGPFTELKLDKVKASQSADPDTLESVNYVRSYVVQTGYKKLFMASNFDQDRENESPEVLTYKKVKE